MSASSFTLTIDEQILLEKHSDKTGGNKSKLVRYCIRETLDDEEVADKLSLKQRIEALEQENKELREENQNLEQQLQPTTPQQGGVTEITPW